MLTIEKKSLKVGKYVTTEHVNTVIRNYKQERWVHNSEHIGKEDSLSVWFSVEELEGFMEKIKQYGADGIKFYFGAYSNDYADKPEYAGRQTLVMVATKHKETETGWMNKDVYVNGQTGTEILAYNGGGICPPNCGGQGRGGSGDGDDWGGIGLTIVDRGDKGLAIV